MLDELRWTRKDRIKTDRISLDKVPPETPNLPQVVVRKEGGLFGKANPRDMEHIERLLDTRRHVVEIDFVEKGMAAIAVGGRVVIVKAVEAMELADEELEPGSLAREVGEKLTEVNAQVLAQSHVAVLKHYAETSIARISRRK